MLHRPPPILALSPGRTYIARPYVGHDDERGTSTRLPTGRPFPITGRPTYSAPVAGVL